MNWDFVLSILSGIAVCIPIVLKLVETILKYTKEKNWSAMVTFVIDYMAEAEQLFSTGAERKTWVMEMLECTAVRLNCNYDDEAKQKVSAMIDDICDASRIINAEVVVNGIDT